MTEWPRPLWLYGSIRWETAYLTNTESREAAVGEQVTLYIIFAILGSEKTDQWEKESSLHEEENIS